MPGLDPLPVRDDGQVDVDTVIRLLRQAADESRLPVRVCAESRLAILSYTGYLQWRDLDQHWESFLTKPLVRHLALTPTSPFEQTGAEPDADLDAYVAAAPIPLDGSQAEAVAAARAGRSFVLEGPPGTGKSQTITNLIADQMAQGRTVLFVAEKGAALDVVRARLEAVGLLPFTLDLHDHSARPAQVRQQLKRALQLRPAVDLNAYQIAAQDTATAAALLADYAERLHQPNPAGLSLYSAHALQLARGSGPSLPVPPEASGLSGTVQQAVGPLSRLGDSWRAWGFAVSGEPAALLPLLEAADQAVDQALQALQQAPDEVRDLLLEAGEPGELETLTRLLSGPAQPSLLQAVTTSSWVAARAELHSLTADLLRRSDPLLERLAPTVAQADLAQTRQQLREAAGSFFLGRRRRLLRAGAPVLAHLLPGAEIPHRQLVQTVEELTAVTGSADQLGQRWRTLLGADLVPPLNLLDPQQRDRLFGLLAQVVSDAERYQRLRPELAQALAAAREHSQGAGPELVGSLLTATTALGALLAAAGSSAEPALRWAATVGSGILQAWQTTQPARAGTGPRLWLEARERLAPLTAVSPDSAWLLLTQQVSATDAVAALERGLAKASAAERFTAGGFAGFDAEQHAETVERYLQSSQDLRQTLLQALPAAVVERRPFRTGRLFGEAGALEREVNRTRGGLSVRQLMSRYGRVIAEVTPCLLVSPDSLARFIPPDSLTFDLVVFDEASQITVPSAIGALGRAEAVVIAGDSKQMPPSRFAQLGESAEASLTADFEVPQDEESILSESVLAQVPRLWLSWHYRSQDESLISFSNQTYYDDRLLTFPAVPGRGHDLGLSFTRVDGRFLRSARKGEAGLLRTNPVEAAAVSDEVLRRWRTGERSIGVVTFNIQQRGLIERLLLESQEPGLAESLLNRHGGVFVKNLESVQGDERDVIIFSTGFSANEQGQLPLNFGPLNRAGGERRLNVAVTRARRRVMVFSSFDPEDLRTEQTSSVGIAHLRRYLELARDGAQTSARQQQVPLDRHRDQIAERLRERGLEVQTGVGLSEFTIDLAIGLPGQPPVLAVLLDGPAWAARRTVGDRDALAATVLEQSMGWPAVARVWLPEWLQDPERVVTRLEQLRAEAASRPRHHNEQLTSWQSTTFEPYPAVVSPDLDEDPTDEPTTAELGSEPTTAELGSEPEPAEPYGLIADPLGLGSEEQLCQGFDGYQPEVLGPASRLSRVGTPAVDHELRDLIGQIVAAEGPVSPERLLRLVVRSYQMSRLTPQRRRDLEPLVPAWLPRDEEGFVYPEDRHPQQWLGYRETTGPVKERPLDDVALREIANAAVDLARTAMGIPAGELTRALGRVFGLHRVTRPAQERLHRAVQLALSDGRLLERAGIISPGR